MSTDRVAMMLGGPRDGAIAAVLDGASVGDVVAIPIRFRRRVRFVDMHGNYEFEAESDDYHAHKFSLDQDGERLVYRYIGVDPPSPPDTEMLAYLDKLKADWKRAKAREA